MSVPSKEALLESFVPGAAFPIRETMLMIYSFGLETPTFVDMAMEYLEYLGCSTIRETYKAVVDEYETEHNAMLKRVSKWYVEWLDQNEETEKRKEAERSRKLRKMSRKDLTMLYQELKKNKIVEDPDQFADLMIQYL